MTKLNTFLGVEAERAEAFELLTNRLFTILTPEQRLSTIEGAILETAQGHNDDATLRLCKLLWQTYYCRPLPYGEMYSLFVEQSPRFEMHLKSLYWQFPDHRPGEKVYDRFDEKKWWYQEKPTLQKAKQWIIGRIGGLWKADFTEENVVCFRFLIAAGCPERKNQLRRDGESDDEMTARGRFISEDEKGAVLQVIRERTDGRYVFPAEKIEPWLNLPCVPDSVRRILAIARTRNGGVELAERDIKYAKLLAPLEPDKRSPTALVLHRQYCELIAEFDELASQLVASMKPERDRWNYDGIGRSEYVAGTIEVTFLHLHDITVTVILEPRCSSELGQDIFGRARRHVERFFEGLESHVGELEVLLFVRGGEGNLDLSYRQRRPQK